MQRRSSAVVQNRFYLLAESLTTGILLALHHLRQGLPARIGQPQVVDLTCQLFFASVPAGVPVEARCGRGVDQFPVNRIDARHFTVQLMVVLKQILLVVVFGHGECA